MHRCVALRSVVAVSRSRRSLDDWQPEVDRRGERSSPFVPAWTECVHSTLSFHPGGLSPARTPYTNQSSSRAAGPESSRPGDNLRPARTIELSQSPEGPANGSPGRDRRPLSVRVRRRLAPSCDGEPEPSALEPESRRAGAGEIKALLRRISSWCMVLRRSAGRPSKKFVADTATQRITAGCRSSSISESGASTAGEGANGQRNAALG